eukprot:scaffold48161_cov63-Phaeocystis_antarctica.AAC.2
MLDITNLRTQRTVVELQTHCVLSSGSRDQSRPSVVPESIAILLCWDDVAITALWGPYNPGGRTMLLIYLRLSQPSENAMLNLAAATSGTLVNHACRPVVWTHSLPSIASATVGYRV